MQPIAYTNWVYNCNSHFSLQKTTPIQNLIENASDSRNFAEKTIHKIEISQRKSLIIVITLAKPFKQIETLLKK